MINLWLVFLAYYQIIYRICILFSACVLSVHLLCFQSVQFLKTNNSQGSEATHLRCSGIRDDRFIANFMLSVAVKKFQNPLIFGEDMDRSLVSCFLWLTVYNSFSLISEASKHVVTDNIEDRCFEFFDHPVQHWHIRQRTSVLNTESVVVFNTPSRELPCTMQ